MPKRGSAVYPGTFDPVTFGHIDIIKRAARIFDKVIVAVAHNPVKRPLFKAKERVRMVKEAATGIPNVVVEDFDGLAVDYAKKAGANVMIRGLRMTSDFEYEFQMAYMNRELWHQLETVFLVPALHLTFLSSSLVREVARLGGDVSPFVHPEVDRAPRAKFGR